MLSGSPTQTKTSVRTIVELSSLIDVAYADGELAYVSTLDVYFRVNRAATSGIQTKSRAGYWTFYSAGAASLSGVGAPTIAPVVGAVYVDTATGSLYAGIAAPLPAWILAASGGGGSNAGALQGVPLSPGPPLDGQAYVYSAATGQYVLATVPTGTAKADFTFATPSPYVLATLAAGATLVQVSVTIATPFNDPAAFVELGTMASPGVVFEPGDVNVQVASTYVSLAPFSTPIPDHLVMLLSPAASTQGRGYVTFLVLPP
ncbi:MAG: hypothetical protein ACHREM_20545 [Polyangiales bacterium]